MPKRMMIWALALILLFGAFPLLTLLSAVLFASAFGCQLDEGSIHPCIVLGLDFGWLAVSNGDRRLVRYVHNTARRIGPDCLAHRLGSLAFHA
jgi:hypothetical protein